VQAPPVDVDVNRAVPIKELAEEAELLDFQTAGEGGGHAPTFASVDSDFFVPDPKWVGTFDLVNVPVILGQTVHAETRYVDRL
jgi:hypothetical protein